MISVGLCCLPAAFIVVTEVDRVLAQHPEYAPEAFPRKALNATDGTPSNLLIILKSALSEYQRSNRNVRVRFWPIPAGRRTGAFDPYA
jgi:hypothetical protein